MTVVDRVSPPLRLVPAAPDPCRTLTLLAEHGDELLAVARLVLADAERGRMIVAEVLQTASREVDPPTRDVLATATFVTCRAALDVAGRADRSATDASVPARHPIDWVARISAQQRSAVALYLHGDLTVSQIAILLNLPTRAVRRLLRAALRELVAARHPG